MAKKRLTKAQKLLNFIRRETKRSGGVTHKEIVKFLLKTSNGYHRKYSDASRRVFDAYLYGTPSRHGVLEFCTKDWITKRYTLPDYAATEGPYTGKREDDLLSYGF